VPVKVVQTARIESGRDKEVKKDRDTLRKDAEAKEKKKRDSETSDKKNSDKDSDKGNTTPRNDEKPLAKSEPPGIASPSIEQIKKKHNRAESARPKPSAAMPKRRREFDTATCNTLFGDMEKAIEVPGDNNTELNDLKALLGNADLNL
jgi:hypothetical protein